MTKEIKWKSLNKTKIKFNIKKDPRGWIQWKGTDVCIDINCKCGESSHFDGMFMYFVRCPHCGIVYEANGYIELIERKQELNMDIKDAEE